LVFFTIFLLVPVGLVIYDSFESGGLIGAHHFVGFKNWTNVWSQALAIESLKNTFVYALMVIPTVFVIGMILALFLRNVKRGGPALRALLYVPALAPVAVAALIWIFLVNPDFGGFNLALSTVGISGQNWLGSSSLALPTIASLEVWRGIGFWTLYFFASLLGLPRELYQAAALDGAGPIRRFFRLTLPLLRPTLLFAAVFATVYALQVFDSVYVLTDGAPGNATATVVLYIYNALLNFNELGLGAVMSVILLGVTLALTLAMMRLLRNRRVGAP